MLHVELNFVAVLVAGVVAFVLGWLWYSPVLFLKPWMRARGMDPATMAGAGMPIRKVITELIRCLVLAFFLAHLVAEFAPKTWMSAAHYGIFLWITFPVILYWGSSLWEDHPTMASLIDAGDWFVKIVSIVLVLFFWR